MSISTSTTDGTKEVANHHYMTHADTKIGPRGLYQGITDAAKEGDSEAVPHCITDAEITNEDAWPAQWHN